MSQAIASASERTRARAAGVARQQRRRRMRLVQLLDDRERLRQHVAVVGDQRRHESLRIEREVVVGALRVAAQVDERALGASPLRLSAMRTRYAADERK